MRGCLFVLLLGVVVAVLFVVVVLPAAAAGLITTGLTAAGLQAADTTVTVSSDPPTDLLGLHADRVHVTATDATFRGIAIGALDLTLTDVAVIDRTVGGVDGMLDDVTVSGQGGQSIPVGSITVHGTGGEVTASTVIPGAQAEALIADAVTRETGQQPASVTLSPPGSVVVDVGIKVRGQFAVTPAGDLVVHVANLPGGLADVVLLSGGTDLPVRLTRVRVTAAGDLRLDGHLAVGILG